MDEMLPNSKLKPEKFEEARVPDDSGDVDEVDAVDGDPGEDVLKAVLRRLKEARGWRGWNREEGIVVIVDVNFVMILLGCVVVVVTSFSREVIEDSCVGALRPSNVW